jgi:hypothetical protein
MASLVYSRISSRSRPRACSSASISSRTPIPRPWACGQDGHIVQQQIARLGNDDSKADDLAVLNGSPRLPVADRLRTAGGHGRRGPADPADVLLVSGSRDRAELIHVARASAAHLQQPVDSGAVVCGEG